MGWVVNLLAVLCITQAGTLLFMFTALMSLFFFPKGFRLDMVSFPCDVYLPLLGLNLLKKFLERGIIHLAGEPA